MISEDEFDQVRDNMNHESRALYESIRTCLGHARTKCNDDFAVLALLLIEQQVHLNEEHGLPIKAAQIGNLELQFNKIKGEFH
jgi:hypothetical protein